MKDFKSFGRMLYTIVITAIVTTIIVLVVVFGANGSSPFLPKLNNKDMSGLISKLNVVQKKIDEQYLKKANSSDLNEWAVKGYVAGLKDKYSQYYTAQEMKEMLDETRGQFVGVGIYLTKDVTNNEIVIYDTIKGSPAAESGIKSGDILIAVDNVACNGDDFDKITEKIKGTKGTEVSLKIKRDKNEEHVFTMKRDKVVVENIESQMIDSEIGYIYIKSFEGDATFKQFRKAYDNLVSKGMKKLIVDVRNNGGGIMEQALYIGELFCNPNQKLIIEKDKDGLEKTTLSKNEKVITMDTILLVNQYSASASEILAGILKENVQNVKIVGVKTYGKGVVQGLFTLPDQSGLKLTIEEYFTPKHSEINGIGITPDVEVKDYQFKGELDKDNDKQFIKALELLKENND
nr:S41 family peptidase [Clostridiales bacterium]